MFQSLLLCVALFGGSYLAAHATTTFKVVQTPSIHLYSGISGVATSMRITPYPRDLDGTKLTITDFGSTPTLTVDPKVTNIEEIISFTAITDNGDNTATLTGLARDLASKYPYTTPGTGRTHGAGATIVFGNNPQVYGRLAAKENDETITGFWLVPDPLAAQGIASKNYVDGMAFGGIGNASEIAKGTVEIATAAEAAAGTTNGTQGRLALPASLSTSTPGAATTLGNVPTTNSTGKLDANFISTSTATNTGILDATSTIFIGDFPAWQIGRNVRVITTTGTTTFSVPSGITKVSVEVQGAGGGSGSTGAGAVSAAGGTGGYAMEEVDVTGTSTIQVYVGAGGTGGSGGAGGQGQWSTFGTNGFYLSATGGNGSALESKDGGQGGLGSGGDINVMGPVGGHGIIVASPSGSYPGVASPSRFGLTYGGGGGGVSASSGGTAGGQGIVIVRW